jgi:hypothetical protein
LYSIYYIIYKSFKSFSLIPQFSRVVKYPIAKQSLALIIPARGGFCTLSLYLNFYEDHRLSTSTVFLTLLPPPLISFGKTSLS